MRVSVSLIKVISHRYSKSLSQPVQSRSHTCIVCESWDHVIPASLSVRKTLHLSPSQRRSLSGALGSEDETTDHAEENWSREGVGLSFDNSANGSG
jgi:hypothetical protein